ncbi:hypothetical protein [Pseudoalteromonas sp. T1lg75]|uniref:hypothetical protein n=1 Tax=Pseudoalteromonas sp. T1lg75 TaxID=2077102 RepID=UPI000CF65A26|nr:hypothetical protein [Pseudoalteromonas sp. T1lg75]
MNKNMISYKHLLKLIAVTYASFMLTACGGDNDNNQDETNVNLPPPPVTKSFTVSLDSVVVTRASNGDAVSVELDNISATAEVTVSQ